MASNEERADVGANAWTRAKTPMIAACAIAMLGLAVAASVERTLGGLLVLVGWAVGVVGLHRLGRAGSANV